MSCKTVTKPLISQDCQKQMEIMKEHTMNLVKCSFSMFAGLWCTRKVGAVKVGNICEI